MNKVILLGRLTRDPDMRYTQGENGTAIARFTVAVDRRRANPDGQRDADFIGCVAFGRQAEFAERWLHQGSRIALVGRIQTGSYTRQDGQRVFTTDVVADELEFAESRTEAEQRMARSSAGGSYQSGGSYQGSGSYQGGGSYQGSGSNQSSASNQRPSHENPAPAPAPSTQASAPAADSSVGEGFMNIPEGIEDESLPFN